MSHPNQLIDSEPGNYYSHHYVSKLGPDSFLWYELLNLSVDFQVPARLASFENNQQPHYEPQEYDYDFLPPTTMTFGQGLAADYVYH